MKLTRVLMIAVLIFALLLGAMPAMAQDGDPGSIFGVQFDPVVIVVVGVVFAMLLLGLLFVLYEAIKRLGVSVPEDSFTKATQAIVDTVQKLLTDLQVETKKTDTPFDDLALEIGRIPLDKLIDLLAQRGLIVVSGQLPPDGEEPAG